MPRRGLPHLRLGLLTTITVALGLVAYGCGGADTTAKPKKILPTDFGDDPGASRGDPIKAPDSIDDKSGTFGAQKRASDGGRDGSAQRGDAGVPSNMYCEGSLSAGDLAVVELMIRSNDGTAPDQSEWLEIQSTRNCWLTVKDLIVASASAAGVTATPVVRGNVDIAPYGTLVIAGSADASLGNAVYAWGVADVLKNDGDTIIVRQGNVEIDRLTYPAFGNLEPRRALGFPSDCPWTARTDWARWSLSFRDSAPGAKGTPNASNDDITCF